MMQRAVILLGSLALVFLIVLLPDISQAVPSYSRQIQKPCTACHTIWPNLNQYGRQFKVKAYTDVSPDWKMITKDRLNLLYILPVSARATSFLYTKEKNKEAGIDKDSTKIPDSAALFIASRVHDYFGVFSSIEFSDREFHFPVFKMAAQYPLGDNTVGLVGFRGGSASADPFNSLGGRDRTLAFGDESTPNVLTKGWTFKFSDEGNLGVVAHGYFLGNRLYAAAGAMRGGRSEDVSGGILLNASGGADVAESDPFDGYFRLAWDQKLPAGAVTFGVAHYAGDQKIRESPLSLQLPFRSKVRRTYVDASLEQNFGEDHLVEVQALYGMGREKNVFGGDEVRKFDGFHVEGSYFYQRMVGLIAAYNFLNNKGVLASDITGDDKRANQWLVSVNFLPWLNTKLALQYAHTRTKFAGDQPSQTDKIFRVVVDLVF
jgi:hypothetical protein